MGGYKPVRRVVAVCGSLKARSEGLLVPWLWSSVTPTGSHLEQNTVWNELHTQNGWIFQKEVNGGAAICRDARNFWLLCQWRWPLILYKVLWLFLLPMLPWLSDLKANLSSSYLTEWQSCGMCAIPPLGLMRYEFVGLPSPFHRNQITRMPGSTLI